MSDAIGYRRGFVMTAFGVLLLTPDALLMRMVDADTWTMVFWRGFLISGTIWFATGFRLGFGNLGRDFRAGGITSFGIAISYAVISICFVKALHITTVAHTLVILASAPLFAALLSMPILKEQSGWATWCAIALGIAGIAFMVSDEGGDSRLIGDVFALVAALGLAMTFVLIRKQKDLNTIPSVCLGGFLAALISLPFAHPFDLNAEQARLVLAMCILMLPLSFALISIGPRSVPAPEVGLLMLLETVLGPFWVWFVLSEMPSERAMIGGGIVICALAGHAVWRFTRPEPAPSKNGLGSSFDGLDEAEIKRLGG